MYTCLLSDCALDKSPHGYSRTFQTSILNTHTHTRTYTHWIYIYKLKVFTPDEWQLWKQSGISLLESPLVKNNVLPFNSNPSPGGSPHVNKARCVKYRYTTARTSAGRYTK